MTAKSLMLALLCVAPSGLCAQAKPSAKDTTPALPPAPPPRAEWLSDRRNVRVGDLITIVVDEHAQSSERTANTAHNTRDQAGSLDIEQVPAALRQIGISYKAHSDKGGSINRSGGLDAVLTVRVSSIEGNGVIGVKGQKSVSMDGRKQDVTIAGLVRTEDIGPANTVSSSRIANAVISYKGKSISPATGLFGKLLAALFP